MEINVAELEQKHVIDIYDLIAHHFNCTRSKPWPNIVKFIKSLRAGSILLDVGCGNGKYFGLNEEIIEIGMDSSPKLLEFCADKMVQVAQGNCMQIPLRDNSVDAVVCIAVIHHLASEERRLHSLKEIARVLRPNGEAVVYVWAKEQRRGSKMSTYMKQKRSNRRKCCRQDKVSEKITKSLPELPADFPIHKNRMEFVSQDVFVPWKLIQNSSMLRKQNKTKIDTVTEPGECSVNDLQQFSELEINGRKVDEKPQPEDDQRSQTFYRYYHVFKESELDELCVHIQDLTILNSYYDEGNWCVQLKKINFLGQQPAIE